VVDLKDRDSGSGPPPVVILESFDEKAPTPLRVEVVFSSGEKDQTAKLAKGHKVKVKGQCAGKLNEAVTIWYLKLVK
jgi:hypothetical protein